MTNQTPYPLSRHISKMQHAVESLSEVFEAITDSKVSIPNVARPLMAAITELKAATANAEAIQLIIDTWGAK